MSSLYLHTTPSAEFPLGKPKRSPVSKQPQLYKTVRDELNECYLRCGLTGMSIFAITFCAIYFFQQPITNRLFPTASVFRYYLPTFVSSIVAAGETSKTIKECREEKLLATPTTTPM